MSQQIDCNACVGTGELVFVTGSRQTSIGAYYPIERYETCDACDGRGYNEEETDDE